MNLINRIRENEYIPKMRVREMIKSYDRKNLKKIVNVYQLEYKNSQSMGIGDYLRGCICLFQICKFIGVDFDMDFTNHPISKYFHLIEKREDETIDYKEVNKYEDSNFIYENGFKKKSIHFLLGFLNFLKSYNSENVYLFCNSFPIHDIGFESREFIKSRLKPKEELLDKICNVMNHLHLIKGNYGVIHIRCGDEYLFDNNKQFDTNKINQLLNTIKKSIQPRKKYLILSDNNNIKFILAKYFLNIVFKINKIAHLACPSEQDESILETLVDFFLITNSNYVLSFSPYPWGSGFSHLPCILFNIPYYNFKL
jgi:hypothetical protein